MFWQYALVMLSAMLGTLLAAWLLWIVLVYLPLKRKATQPYQAREGGYTFMYRRGTDRRLRTRLKKMLDKIMRRA